MNLIFWLFAGLVISIIATRYSDHLVKGGIAGAAALSTFGAIQGGFIANVLLKSSLIQFDVPSLFIAISGSVAFLALGKAFSLLEVDKNENTLEVKRI